MKTNSVEKSDILSPSWEKSKYDPNHKQATLLSDRKDAYSNKYACNIESENNLSTARMFFIAGLIGLITLLGISLMNCAFAPTSTISAAVVAPEAAGIALTLIVTGALGLRYTKKAKDIADNYIKSLIDRQTAIHSRF